MNETRAVLVLALFFGGLVAGVVVQRVTDNGGRANPYPSLDRVRPLRGSCIISFSANANPRRNAACDSLFRPVRQAGAK